MKYEELFQLKDFQKGKLLTGNNILLREITGAHVIEMADGVNWAGRGELVFTSGVGFHDIDNEMKLLIETVVKIMQQESWWRLDHISKMYHKNGSIMHRN